MQNNSPQYRETYEPVGLGAGWSNPLRLTGLGRNGEILNLQVRGDVTDATAGTAELLVFRAPPPLYGMAPGTGGQPSNVEALVANLDPAAIPTDDWFVHVTGLTVNPDALLYSDKVNVRSSTGNTGVYSQGRPDIWVWVAIKGVTGKVFATLDAEGS